MPHDELKYPELSELLQAVQEEARQRVRDDCARVPEDVAALLEEIACRLFDPTFDISALRREHAPSRETLWRFRTLLGLNPKSYLNLRRCEAAKRLLGLTDAPLSMIAAGLGFSDAELFSKWFKGQTGETPSQHREASRPTSQPDAVPPDAAPSPRPPSMKKALPRLRRLLLGDLDPGEAGLWLRRLRAGDRDEA